MLSSWTVKKLSFRMKCPLHTCYRNFQKKKLIRKQSSQSKKSINIERKATDRLLFGSVFKKTTSQEPKFPLSNPERGNKFQSDSINEIFSISIFQDGYKKLPSVRNILDKTMPEENKKVLEAWKKKMTAKLGAEGFELHQQGLFDRGHIFHSCIEQSLRGNELSEEQLVGIENYWASIQHVLAKISDVRLLESRVIHSALDYQGSVDCVAIYKNTPAIFEFKTSSRPKVTLESTYDSPLQAVAYIGALNYDPSYDLPNINEAAVVYAYPTGFPAHVHVLKQQECFKYWKLWMQRLDLYRKLQEDDKHAKE